MDTTQNRLAGYAFLIEQYDLSALPNWHSSSVSPTGTLRSTIQDGQVESVYPQSYWPGDGTGDHLEFALKYDGACLDQNAQDVSGSHRRKLVVVEDLGQIPLAVPAFQAVVDDRAEGQIEVALDARVRGEFRLAVADLNVGDAAEVDVLNQLDKSPLRWGGVRCALLVWFMPNLFHFWADRETGPA
ncbi:MAG: hypothetical protein SWH68_05540 [Thermodesulfobacteriota bacterium]|nr:hypothetical protein [Thermodesulfobacteriota bacterium]